MKKWFPVCTIFTIVLLLTGCGGGKSGSSNPATTTPEQPPVTFRLTLTDIDVRRTSNAEAIVVDTAGINSGTLLLRQRD
jgi:hypothetical protein